MRRGVLWRSAVLLFPVIGLVSGLPVMPAAYQVELKKKLVW